MMASSSAPHILLVEDDTRYANRLKKNLTLEGYEVVLASSGAEALQSLDEHTFDLIVSDIRMPGMDGIELLRRIHQMEPEKDAPFIALTSVDSVEVAVEAMKEGAADYITKDAGRDEILLRIDKVLQGAQLRDENRRLRQQVRAARDEGAFIARSPQMLDLLREIDAVADTGAGILIVGETGVGKEVIARYIHECSPRAENPFVDVNCAALPTDNMFQSEVFGHEKGAFTGAAERKQGKLELADSGTLFLDEIGDMPLESQGKILRAIETQTFERLGGSQKIRVNLAIIAATNKDLNRAVQEGLFRQDLLYRLDIIRLNIPPLRERPEEILPLTQHFFEQYANKYRRAAPEIAEPARKLLESYSWPGNVRELKNLVERIVIRNRDCPLIDEEMLRREGLQEDAAKAGPAPPQEFEGHEGDEFLSLEEIERNAIVAALERTGWVQSEAAKLLKISPDRMHTRIKKYGIHHPSWRTHK